MLYITCHFGRQYQNICRSVKGKRLGVMSSSDFGIRRHNNPDLSCHLGAKYLVCDPRSHVTLYTFVIIGYDDDSMFIVPKDSDYFRRRRQER